MIIAICVNMKLKFFHHTHGVNNLNRVTLQLNGNLANVCLKHLKHNDLVYVSGLLNSYGKVSETGERYIYYKVSQCLQLMNR
jgi:hypothetical protein